MKSIETEAGCDLDSIRHSGIVRDIDERFVYVSVVSQSACAACHAKGACNVSDMNEEIIEIPRASSTDLKAGDQVSVVLKKSLGTKAVMLGYVVPFLLVLGTMIAMVTTLEDEGLAGLISLGVLVPYYVILYLQRDRLKRTFSFSLQ
jgi:sigma-E factor negative regulatory protein RseC